MKFYQRFAYYLIGLVFGCFFVAAVWSGKDVSCNYFPNARVLNDLRNKPFDISENAQKTLAEGWISKSDIKLILTNGDVDFDRSNVPMDHGKRYIIQGKTSKKQPVMLEVVNYDEKAVLKSVTRERED